MEEFSSEEVADEIIKEMIKTGKWEQLRIELASTLRVEKHFEETELRVQRILSTNEQLKKIMREPETTEQDVAQMVERLSGIQSYKIALEKALDGQIGSSLQREVGEMVDDFIDRPRKPRH